MFQNDEVIYLEIDTENQVRVTCRSLKFQDHDIDLIFTPAQARELAEELGEKADLAEMQALVLQNEGKLRKN